MCAFNVLCTVCHYWRYNINSHKLYVVCLPSLVPTVSLCVSFPSTTQLMDVRSHTSVHRVITHSSVTQEQVCSVDHPYSNSALIPRNVLRNTMTAHTENGPLSPTLLTNPKNIKWLLKVCPCSNALYCSPGFIIGLNNWYVIASFCKEGIVRGP